MMLLLKQECKSGGKNSLTHTFDVDVAVVSKIFLFIENHTQEKQKIRYK